MSAIEGSPYVTSPAAADRVTPPQTKLMIFVFPDEVKVDQALDAIVTKQRAENRIVVYRLALAEKMIEDKVSIRDISEDWLGPVGTGALIGGLSGLAGGPLGALIGAGAGALFGWSAELLNEGTVTEFVRVCLRELAVGHHAIVAEIAADSAASFEALIEENGGRICK
ncbi:MAG TPA: hypothetical protein VMU69_18140 [Bradyrhizobium sp.]|nr:hypothetical protein [Stellaceae bacterium]HUN98140.1 hypothetical protein [Bradyrhizobium sp.]